MNKDTIDIPGVTAPLPEQPVSAEAAIDGSRGLTLDPAEAAKVLNRLRRAHGQLAGVVRMLEEGRSCQDVVVQLAAVSKALDRAGFALISSGLHQCLVASHGLETADVQKLRRLFLALA